MIKEKVDTYRKNLPKQGASTMKRVFLKLPLITLLLTLATTGLMYRAGEAAKPAKDTPVTTTIEGLGPDSMPTLRVQSDQLGAYKNSSSLQSILQAALGDWVLDTLNYTSFPQRKVLIDL